jgi:hypothetical protein
MHTIALKVITLGNTNLILRIKILFQMIFENFPEFSIVHQKTPIVNKFSLFEAIVVCN